MRGKNYMKLEIPALSENESFARVAVGAFMTRLNPTLEEISDVKTAVSEAVTNAIVHGYENRPGVIFISAEVADDELFVEIDRWLADGMKRPKRLKMAKPAALAMAEASLIPLD